MKEFYKEEHLSAFIDLKNKIKTACANCIDKTLLIDDNLAKLDAYKNILTTAGNTPEECFERGLFELANNKFSKAIADFNTAEKQMEQGDPFRQNLFFYRSLASNKGKINTTDNDYKRATSLGFNKITIYEIKTVGKRVKPGSFLVNEKRKLKEWSRAQAVATRADKFFHAYAKILWNHFQLQHPTSQEAQEIYSESKKEVLSEMENYLIGLKKDFNKKVIQQIIKLVSKELSKPVKPTKNESPFISSEDKPESERRRIAENYTLASIRELYLTHTDIKSERQIQFNIALVLNAVNFWTERTPRDGKKRDKYVRRLKSRWIDVEKIAFNITKGLKFIEDQFKVCPSETIEE